MRSSISGTDAIRSRSMDSVKTLVPPSSSAMADNPEAAASRESRASTSAAKKSGFASHACTPRSSPCQPSSSISSPENTRPPAASAGTASDAIHRSAIVRSSGQSRGRGTRIIVLEPPMVSLGYRSLVEALELRHAHVDLVADEVLVVIDEDVRGKAERRVEFRAYDGSSPERVSDEIEELI